MFSINKLVKSVFPAVSIAKKSMVNWVSGRGKIRAISQISGNDDHNKCFSCKLSIPDEVKFKEIMNLPARQTFSGILSLAGRCRRIGKESSLEKTAAINCLFASRIVVVARAMLSEGVASVIFYDKESAQLSLDIFLRRRDPTKEEGDLTGEGGLLTFDRLKERNELDCFASIIDIGGARF